MAGLNTPLVMITQDSEMDHSPHIRNEVESPGGVASNVNYGVSQNDVSLPERSNGTAEVKNVNSGADPNTDSASIPSQDFSLAFYQQQLMLNHQLFIQQQQTVSALMGKVEGLAKIVESQSGSPNENTRVKHLPTIPEPITRKTHVLSDVSSDSENSSSGGEEEESERSETESRPYNGNEKKDSVTENSENQTEINDNMKLLMDLSRELGKVEAVSNKVDDTLSEVVNIGIRAQIDRNLAKDLCSKYKRPENCKALVVPKINKELWNTTSIAKSTKEQDKVYQTAQRYLNQGLIPLVQLMDNVLKEKEPENNFRLARDAFQLLAYAHRDISNLRRQKLKTVVSEKYRPLCNDSTPLTDNLLGDELEKQIKTLDEMRKVGNDITKHRSEKRRHKYDQYEKATKYTKYNNYSGHRNKDKGSFLEKRSRYHKPGHHKGGKKNQKQ